jgi:hypothetical protein
LKIDHFKQLYETTAKLNSRNVILIGDFNARTQSLKDTLNKDKHEENVIDDFYSEIHSIRNNQDETLNNYGKQLIEYCISTRSYIANGRTLGDIQGKLTCHKSNGSSTVDYAVITENLKKYVKSFEVLNPDTGSDHSPISLQLSCPYRFSTQFNMGSQGITSTAPPFRWNDKTKNLFEINIVSGEAARMIEKLDQNLEDDSIEVDSHVLELNEIYTENLTNRQEKKHQKPKKTKKEEPEEIVVRRDMLRGK